MPKADRASAEIKAEFADAKVQLVPGGRGVFDVKLNGANIFSRAETRRYLEPGEIVSLLRARLGS